MSKQNKGIVQSWILIVIIVLLIGGGIFAWQHWGEKEEVKTPEEEVSPPAVSEQEEEEVIPTKDETADWRVYENEELGYEIKYPPDFYFYEISPGDIFGTASKSISFQEKERWEGRFEWPRFEVKIFKNDNLPLLSWIQERWFLYDIAMDSEAMREKLPQTLGQREEITMGDYQTIKIPHPLDDEYAYFLFVPNNNGESVAKLTCILGESISTICNNAFTTFRFLKKTENGTADWKTYRNEKYGFEVKYPPFLKYLETYEPDDDHGAILRPENVPSGIYVPQNIMIVSPTLTLKKRGLKTALEAFISSKDDIVKPDKFGRQRKILEDYTIKLVGIDAYTFISLDFDNRPELFNFISGDNVSTYVEIEMLGDPGTSQKLKEFDQKILSTFKFID